jgi:hypothetical protein
MCAREKKWLFNSKKLNYKILQNMILRQNDEVLDCAIFFSWWGLSLKPPGKDLFICFLMLS